MQDYSWVTQEMFDKKLEDIVEQQKGGALLRIPGVYEIVKEHYNNDVLEELEEDRYWEGPDE